MPTTSHDEQRTRDTKAFSTIADFSGSLYELARKLNINYSYVYTASKPGGCCSPKLWKALVREGFVQPIPREQKSFMVPIDNFEIAVMKFQEHYPDAVVMKEWEQS
jgi:hypothetical protein